MENQDNNLVSGSFIITKCGQKVLVSPEDVERASKFNWRVYTDKKSGYKSIRVTHCGVQMKLHRFIMKIDDPKIIVDHKEQNIFDVRRESLRVACQQRNMRNRTKKKGCKIIYKGVTRSHGKFQARIQIDHKTRRSLGVFDTEIESAHAYDKAALKFFGEFAILNFPINETEEGLNVKRPKHLTQEG